MRITLMQQYRRLFLLYDQCTITFINRMLSCIELEQGTVLRAIHDNPLAIQENNGTPRRLKLDIESQLQHYCDRQQTYFKH